MENKTYKWTCPRCNSGLELHNIDEEVKKCNFCGLKAESLKESDKNKKVILKG